nr:hypothetical protein [Tanacetum cinerariifolium]
MLIFQEAGSFSLGGLSAVHTVGGIPFFLDFSLIFNGTCDVALNEISCSDLLMLALLLSLVCLRRDETSDPSLECTSFFLPPNRVETFMSLWPSLINTVVLTGLLWRVGLVPSRISPEKRLVLRERCVSLDAANGARFVLGNVVEVMGSRVLMEMGEKMAEKAACKHVGKRYTGEQ